tara:strand:- start:15681 stop:16325 length:645 start_codon:yes stop_codon:yes gene_type:complete
MDASVYTRPKKTLLVEPKRYEKAPALAPSSLPIPSEIAVSGATECHVTPAALCRRMLEYLSGTTGRFLEPEAGTGNIIAAMLAAGVSANQITAVEQHGVLAEAARKRFTDNDGVTIKTQCFLEYSQEHSGEKFDYIAMNPPFRKCRQHINAALDLLADVGELVAVVPVTFEHEQASDLETLPRGTFSTAAVLTKLVLFSRLSERNGHSRRQESV